MTYCITPESLKTQESGLESTFPEDTALRLHRSISWLACAERQEDDDDAAFIFYWIAFNAAYARENDEWSATMDGQRTSFKIYFEKIANLDTENRIYDELWARFSDPIRNLMRNKFVFQPFWNYYNQIPGSDHWEERFEREKQKGLKALQQEDTARILYIIFDRLYVLRNQVFHGAATWQGSVNRDQIRDAKNILASLIPIFLDLMMKNPETQWGRPCYPVIERI